MECPIKPVVPALLILILIVQVMATEPGMALKLEPAGTSTHIPPLLDCAPAPAARSNNLSAFHDNLLALLDALPPAVAAAAPTGGFATAQSGGGDRAFARAFCYGFGSSPSPSDCLKVLICRRRGCGPAALGTCVADRTAAECSRCLNQSAQVVPALKEGRRLSLGHGDAVVVVGYSCYLRVPLFHPVIPWPQWVNYAVGVFDVVVVLLIEIGGIMCCIHIARQLNPAP